VRVYLCGSINGKTDAECRAWRDAAAELLRNLGHEPVDPMVRDYRGREAQNAHDIVDGDLADIRSCDAVIVKADAPSWGTAMEVLYAAREARVPVVAYGAPENPSPWLLVHARAFAATVDQAVAIVHQHGRRSRFEQPA
jgi:nucleoside 2-deoxyribosyltransferase